MIKILPRSNPRTPWRPWDELDAGLRRLMEEFGEGLESPVPALAAWSPAAELVEKDDGFGLTFELPGLTQDDVEIELQDNLLTVRGEKKEEFEEEKPRYHVWERRYGKFQRSLDLPRNVDPEKIEAEFENGVLKVRMPKTSEARAQKIEIGTRK